MTDRSILSYEDDFGTTEIECDCCGETLLLDCVQWPSVNEEKKAAGWFSRQVDGEWHDFCSQECYRAFLNDRR